MHAPHYILHTRMLYRYKAFISKEGAKKYVLYILLI
jgi:hypothetical protein